MVIVGRPCTLLRALFGVSSLLYLNTVFKHGFLPTVGQSPPLPIPLGATHDGCVALLTIFRPILVSPDHEPARSQLHTATGGVPWTPRWLETLRDRQLNARLLPGSLSSLVVVANITRLGNRPSCCRATPPPPQSRAAVYGRSFRCSRIVPS